MKTKHYIYILIKANCYELLSANTRNSIVLKTFKLDQMDELNKYSKENNLISLGTIDMRKKHD